MTKQGSFVKADPGTIDSDDGDFIHFFMKPDPRDRLSATDALMHPWLNGVYRRTETCNDRSSLGPCYRTGNVDLLPRMHSLDSSGPCHKYEQLRCERFIRRAGGLRAERESSLTKTYDWFSYLGFLTGSSVKTCLACMECDGLI